MSSIRRAGRRGSIYVEKAAARSRPNTLGIPSRGRALRRRRRLIARQTISGLPRRPAPRDKCCALTAPGCAEFVTAAPRRPQIYGRGTWRRVSRGVSGGVSGGVSSRLGEARASTADIAAQIGRIDTVMKCGGRHRMPAEPGLGRIAQLPRRSAPLEAGGVVPLDRSAIFGASATSSGSERDRK